MMVRPASGDPGMKTVFAVVLCLLPPLIAADELADPDTEERAIRARRAAFNEAIARNDADAIREFLDEPFHLAAGDGDLLEGSMDYHIEGWAEHFAAYDEIRYVRSPQTIEVSRYVPRAWEQGRWRGYAVRDGLTIERSGRYSAAWNKVAGTWRIAAELYVTLDCDGDGC
jgi:ketosteroid isomerase-like protein